jgi:hypothetical protein
MMAFDPTGGIGPAIIGRMDEEYEHGITVADEIAELRRERKDELISEAMEGRGPFWDQQARGMTAYDNEQQFEVFELVRKVLAMPTLKDETRWRLFVGLLREGEVERYAHSRVNE